MQQKNARENAAAFVRALFFPKEDCGRLPSLIPRS